MKSAQDSIQVTQDAGDKTRLVIDPPAANGDRKVFFFGVRCDELAPAENEICHLIVRASDDPGRETVIPVTVTVKKG